MTEPIYVQSAKMFQDIFISLQHHGRADLVMMPEEEKRENGICRDCKCELTNGEIEENLGGRCYLCHDIAEVDNPSPEEVEGKENLI